MRDRRLLAAALLPNGLGAVAALGRSLAASGPSFVLRLGVGRAVIALVPIPAARVVSVRRGVARDLRTSR